MSYSFEVKPDAPIIIFTREPGDGVMEELEASLADTVALLDQQPEPVFLIIDLRITLDLSEHVQASSLIGRGENPLLHHPKIREAMFVSTDALINVVVKGFDTTTFGMVHVNHFETLQEALDYCYSRFGAASLGLRG